MIAVGDIRGTCHSESLDCSRVKFNSESRPVAEIEHAVVDGEGSAKEFLNETVPRLVDFHGDPVLVGGDHVGVRNDRDRITPGMGGKTKAGAPR